MDSAVQDGETALERASIKGHQKVVELLLRAGANPDLQDKVKVEHVHANLSNGKWYVIECVCYPDSQPYCTTHVHIQRCYFSKDFMQRKFPMPEAILISVFI